MNIAVFAGFIKRGFLVQVFVLAALSQILWLTTCAEEEEGQDVKTILVRNIPSSLEFTQAAKAQIDSSNEGKGNPYVHFSQVAGNYYIKTDGLYIMALFLPIATAATEVNNILKQGASSQDMVDFGAAFALMKISGGSANERLITLSTKADEIGYYWDGGNNGEEYNICLLLLTPDARFILRTDISTQSYPGTQSEYSLQYEPVFDIPDASTLNGITDILAFIKGTTQADLSTMFRVKTVTGASAADSNEAEELLSDNFIDDLFSRFS